MCGRANFSRVSKLWKAGFDAGVHGAVFGTDGPACFFSSGAPESQWASGAAALDSLDAQVFARDLLRKVQVAPGGLARIPEEGEQSGGGDPCRWRLFAGFGVPFVDAGGIGRSRGAVASQPSGCCVTGQ